MSTNRSAWSAVVCGIADSRIIMMIIDNLQERELQVGGMKVASQERPGERRSHIMRSKTSAFRYESRHLSSGVPLTVVALLLTCMSGGGMAQGLYRLDLSLSHHWILA